MNTQHVDYASALREAFELSIDILGSSGKQAVIEEVVRAGVDIDSSYLSVDELRNGLLQVLGVESADLIIRSVFKNLQKMLEWK